jgi:hypothetical protein
MSAAPRLEVECTYIERCKVVPGHHICRLLCIGNLRQSLDQQLHMSFQHALLLFQRFVTEGMAHKLPLTSMVDIVCTNKAWWATERIGTVRLRFLNEVGAKSIYVL